MFSSWIQLKNCSLDVKHQLINQSINQSKQCDTWITPIWRYQRDTRKEQVKEGPQYNDQHKKDKRTNNYLQNTTHETKIEQHESLKIREWAQVLWKDRQFLLHQWHSSFTLSTKRVNEWRKERIMISTNGTPVVIYNSVSINQVMKDFKLTTRNLGFSSFLVSSNQDNHDRNHKLNDIVSTERYILHIQVLLKCCHIWMESSQLENWNHFLCRKVSFITRSHCQCQGMKQAYLYV